MRAMAWKQEWWAIRNFKSKLYCFFCLFVFSSCLTSSFCLLTHKLEVINIWQDNILKYQLRFIPWSSSQPTHKAWPLANGLVTWIWGGSHHFCQKKSSFTVSKLFRWATWFISNSCFLSRSLGFGGMWSRGCLPDQPPTKSSSTDSLTSFPGRQHFTCVFATQCWED